jgi:hypothetical protein
MINPGITERLFEKHGNVSCLIRCQSMRNQWP